MTDAATLLAEFVDALHSGSMPDAGAFLARADTVEQRKELAAGIETVLDLVPDQVRHPRDSTGAFVLGIPAERIAEAARATWTTALPYWRGLAGMSVKDLATAALHAAGLKDDSKNLTSATGWIEAMETGAESVRSISVKARAALAEALGVSREAFDEAGEFASAGAIAFRAEGIDDAAQIEQNLGQLAERIIDATPPTSAVDQWFAA
jgi:hypothetical protein